MSLRVALGCHPDLGEEDAHVRATIHGLSVVGAEITPLTRPDQWPDTPPDVLHYVGQFHVQSAVNLVAHAQRLGVPFFLTCRLNSSDCDQNGDLWQRGQAAAIAAARVLFVPESNLASLQSDLDRKDLVALPEMPDLPALETADAGAFRTLFKIDRPYLLLLADRVEEEQQQHLLLAAAKMTGLPAVVLGSIEPDDYRSRCEFEAAPATVYAGALPAPLRGGALFGAAAAVLMAPRQRDHATHLLTALAAGQPVVAGPGITMPEGCSDRVTIADPQVPALFAAAIQAALDSNRPPRPPAIVEWTPENLGCALLRGYGAIPAQRGLA